jgi:hypothetical protein
MRLAALRAMKLASALGALALPACHPAASPEPAPARCGPSVPETAQHPIATQPAALAGEYELIQVQTQPASGAVISGHLNLMLPDSSARAAAVGGPGRDLIGWLELERGDPAWRAAVASRDPMRPGAVLASQHLRLGQAGYPDGIVEHLTITAVAPEGFWGWWRADRGVALAREPGSRRLLPDPAGYFCALRRGAGR